MKELVQEAAEMVGGQSELARRIGRSQQLVQKLCVGERRVTAEVAVAIDAATGGGVAKHHLRPDLFEQPADDAAEAAA